MLSFRVKGFRIGSQGRKEITGLPRTAGWGAFSFHLCQRSGAGEPHKKDSLNPEL